MSERSKRTKTRVKEVEKELKKARNLMRIKRVDKPREGKKGKKGKEPSLLQKADRDFTLTKLLVNGKPVVGSRILYFGRSGCGKTTLLFKRLERQYTKESPTGRVVNKRAVQGKWFIMFLPSFETNRAWEGHEAVKALFEKPYGEHVHDMSEETLHALKITVQNKIDNEKLQPIIVLDDLGGNTTLKLKGERNNIVNLLAKMALHYSVVMISLFQQVTQASPVLRENPDDVTIFKTENEQEMKKIHALYFGEIEWKNFRTRWNDLFADQKFGYLTVRFKSGGEKELFFNGKRRLTL